MFFFLRQRYNNGPREFFLSDKNEELIICYKSVKNSLEKLIPILKDHREKHCPEYFAQIRSMRPEDLSSYSERAARFIYLNKTCYNGLYRVNSNGRFNVPIGRYTNPGIFDEKKLMLANKLLQNVEIETRSYEYVLDHAEKNDFIYLDPPYYSESKTANFTNYNGSSFSKKDQENVAMMFEELHSRGCFVMLSNGSHEFIRSLYGGNGHTIKSVKAKRMINCIAKKRNPVEDIVVRNYQ